MHISLVVTIFGARQVGKTPLAKMFYKMNLLKDPLGYTY